MRSRRTAVLGALAALLVAAEAEAIIGGELSPPDAYPAVGVIHDPLQPAAVLRCSGTLVAPDWVLTAGHCNVLASGRFTLRPDDALGTGGESHQIDRFLEAPDYVTQTGDAALAHLATSSAVAPMRVAGPAERERWTAGTPALLLGYGAESQALAVPAGLKQAAATILSDAECAAAYPPGADLRVADAARDICADLGPATGGPGDSGGPLLVRGPDGRQRIVGVTSGYGTVNVDDSPLMLGRVADAFMRPWLAATAPGALGSPPPTLAENRVGRRRFAVTVTGDGVTQVRFAARGRRTTIDRAAPFRRVFRVSKRLRVRAEVTGPDGVVTLRRRLG